MAGLDIDVDHSTVHHWVIKLVPLFQRRFRKHKRPVGKSRRVARVILGDIELMYMIRKGQVSSSGKIPPVSRSAILLVDVVNNPLHIAFVDLFVLLRQNQ
jgi:hypothetical protein